MSEPVTSNRSGKTGWRRLFHGRFLLISIAFHLLLAVLATYLVVQSLAPRKQTFKAGTAPGNPAQKAVEHQVQLAQKQKSMSAPAAAKKIVTTGLAKVVLPEIPDMPATSMPNKMQTMGAPGLGFGTGTGMGGAGGGTGAGKSVPFFGSKDKAMGLPGILYDLKQTRNRQETKVDNKEYHAEVSAFIRNGMKAEDLNRFFRSPKPIYASQIFIPIINAEDGPKAFGLEKQVEPNRWVILYEGKVRAPESGDFRFVGFADDILVVRLDGKLVLDGSHQKSLTDLKATATYRYPASKDKDLSLLAGEWFKVNTGQICDIQILIGEQPGTWFYAQLLIEKQNGNYRKNDRGEPILPIFRVANAAPPKLKPGQDGVVETDNDRGRIWAAVEGSRPSSLRN